MPERPFQVFIDFDGTLVVPNVAILLVTEFGRDGRRIAREIDLRLKAGALTLREAWEQEAALLPADRIDEMAEFVVRNAPLRHGARELIELLDRHEVPCTIVSGGLDFYIDPVLRRESIDWPVRSETLERADGGAIQVGHPYGHPTCRLCGICKAALVGPSDGRASVFIGDGSTDRYAAEVADLVFARHRLLDHCRERDLPHLPFDDLDPVVERLDLALSGRSLLPWRRSVGATDSPCPISRALVGPREPS